MMANSRSEYHQQHYSSAGRLDVERDDVGLSHDQADEDSQLEQAYSSAGQTRSALAHIQPRRPADFDAPPIETAERRFMSRFSKLSAHAARKQALDILSSQTPARYSPERIA